MFRDLVTNCLDFVSVIGGADVVVFSRVICCIGEVISLGNLDALPKRSYSHFFFLKKITMLAVVIIVTIQKNK